MHNETFEAYHKDFRNSIQKDTSISCSLVVAKISASLIVARISASLIVKSNDLNAFAFAPVSTDVSAFLDSGTTAVLPTYHTIDYRVHGDG